MKMGKGSELKAFRNKKKKGKERGQETDEGSEIM